MVNHHPKTKIPKALHDWLSKIGKNGAKTTNGKMSKAAMIRRARAGGKAKARNADRDRQ